MTQIKGSAVNVEGQSIPGEDSYDPGHSSTRKGMKCNRIKIRLCGWRLITVMLHGEQDAPRMKMSFQQGGSPRAFPRTQGDKNNPACFRIEPASFAKGIT